MAEHPEITITVHGAVGIGKSTVALAIIDLLRGHGLECAWQDEAEERGLGVGSDDVAYLERKPTVRLVETNPTMAGDFDLVAHLHRQREFSERTFGPGARTAGVLDHIRKELTEVEADPGDVFEWVDLVILALDGAWRAGHAPRAIVDALVAKQTRNEGRSWPDWRTADPGKAIEHDRSGEVTGDGAGEALPDMATLPRIAPPIAPMGEEDDEYMPVTDPAALASALVEISHALECTPTLEDMLHAVDDLRERVARTIDRRLEVVITTTLGCDSTPTAIAEALRALVDRAGPDPARG